MFTTSTGRLRPAWSFVLAAGFSAVAFLAGGYVADAVAGDHVVRFELVFRPLLCFLLFGIYLWLLTVADQVEQHRLAALGFPTRQGWRAQLAGGCVLGWGLTTVAVIPVAIWGGISVHLRLNAHSLLRLVATVVILVFGSLAEELMFRGYPFQRLEEAVGPWLAITFFSVLFGVVHLHNPGASAWGLANTVGIGLVLALAYLRTRALWLPWGIHFAWNATLGLSYGLPVSGLRLFNVVVRSVATGPRWLTGGSYGIEASAPGAAAVLVGLIIVWKWPVRRLGERSPLPPPPVEHLADTTSIQN